MRGSRPNQYIESWASRRRQKDPHRSRCLSSQQRRPSHPLGQLNNWTSLRGFSSLSGRPAARPPAGSRHSARQRSPPAAAAPSTNSTEPGALGTTLRPLVLRAQARQVDKSPPETSSRGVRISVAMSAAADSRPAALVGKVVLPGDAVSQIPESGQVRIGAGLQQQGDSIVTLKAGLAQQTTTGKIWIQGTQKRYMPAKDDLVVGVVTDRHGENFAVDIRGPFPATLPMLSFEGASRRNRPNVTAGDVVYCRVEVAHRDIDPILSCVDGAGKANGMGVLKAGYIFTCSTYLARRLLARPVCAVLEALGNSLKFEMAVGMNGQVWLNSDSAETTIIASNAIIASEYKSDAQARQAVKELLKWQIKA